MDKKNTLLFEKALGEIIGDIDPGLYKSIEKKIEWTHLKGGEYLFRKNEESDSLYIIIRGRLTAWSEDKNGKQVILGDIVRGETVGELAMFTGNPRSADVIAARDSFLAKLSKKAFLEILAKSPKFSLETTRLIINRFTNTEKKKSTPPPVNISIVSCSETINLDRWISQITKELSRHGNVALVSSSILERELGQHGVAEIEDANSNGFRDVANYLADLEEKNDFVIYKADQDDSNWTARCKRQADKVVLLADASGTSEISQVERSGLDNRLIPSTLVLIHSHDTDLPANTNDWLSSRTWLADHYHIREGHSGDLARLTRIISGNAIGLVLAGGGAKGFAHIGIYQALVEYGIPVDFVGGTSIGATVAAAIAIDKPEKLRKYMKKAALYNPTKDLNWWPIISLMKGVRVHDMIQRAIHDFTGRNDIKMEDSWITHFAISSNYTQARQEIHRHGSLLRNLLASIAIPGVFPPVVSGNDLLIDGGTFNNFPVDVMLELGAKKIIGCDLFSEKKYELKFDRAPTSWQILMERFKPKKDRIYRLPGLTGILLNSTILYSSSKRSESHKLLDLLFNPNLSRFGMTKWKAYDKIVDTGYKHAKEVLSGLSTEDLQALRG